MCNVENERLEEKRGGGVWVSMYNIMEEVLETQQTTGGYVKTGNLNTK